jgi:signal transduction histidine kinase
MSKREATVPLALCLALALVAIVGWPTLTTWGLSRALDRWEQQAKQAQLAAVRRILGDDVARWHDPTWQRRAGPAFAALGVDVGLVDKRARRANPVFTTGDARGLMGAAGLTPAVAASRKQVPHGTVGKMAMAAADTPGSSLTFGEIAIMGPDLPAGRPRAVGVADLWFTRPPPGQPLSWLPSVGGLVSLVLTLAVVATILGHSVLRPLAAMSRVAQRIGSGDLEVRLPSSRAREVAAVSAALATMSAGVREATRRQAELEQERRLFIGAIAHDLRTPLFTLSAYLSGLRDGVAKTPDRAMHYVAVCQEQAAALERLIADLFAYTKVEYLEQEPRREPLEMGALLHGAALSLEPRAAAHGVTLVVSGPPERCPLIGDAQLLTRAVENLLDNAIRYTPGGGCIAVQWRREATAVVFTVEDSGPGIATHDLPHVFTPLYRGEVSRNRQTGGAGLGLTIARRILQAHRGDLIAANGATGGALFTGTLPVEGPMGGALPQREACASMGDG